MLGASGESHLQEDRMVRVGHALLDDGSLPNPHATSQVTVPLRAHRMSGLNSDHLWIEVVNTVSR